MLTLVIQLVAAVILVTALVTLLCLGLSTAAHQRMLDQDLREIRRRLAILEAENVQPLKPRRTERLHG